MGIPRRSTLVPDTRWRLRAAAEEGRAAPEVRQQPAAPRLEPGLMLEPGWGSPSEAPVLCFDPGAPIPQVAAVGLLLTPHSWEGGTWGIERTGIQGRE